MTQANIGSTICSGGWTETVRPPESYTEPLKYRELAEYGETGGVWNYEEDHLIPLELGGSPTSLANLWPEPGASPNPKDAVEDAGNAAVCNGSISLAYAQHAIATNWIAFGRQLGVAMRNGPAPSPTTTTTVPPPTTTTTAPPATTTTATPPAPPPPPPPTTVPATPVAWCHAFAVPYTPHPGDYDVHVTSDEPFKSAVASDATDSYSYETNAAGSAVVYLWNQSPGELINVTVGAAHCSTVA